MKTKIQEIITKMKNHFQKNKVVWMAVLAVLLVALIIVLGVMVGKRNKKNPLVCAPGDLYNIETGEPCEGVEIPEVVDCAVGDAFSIKTGEPCPDAPKEEVKKDYLSYAEALKTYEGKTIMLNEACQGTPGVLTVPAKTLVMVANGSPKAHNVTFAGRTLNLRPSYYDLFMTSAGANYDITCNGNVAGTVTTTQ